MSVTEIDFMEYATDAAARAAYVTNATPALDANFPTTTQDDNGVLPYTGDSIEWGQTFTALSSGSLYSVKFNLKKGSQPPTGNIWCNLYLTSGGAPTGSPVAVSASIDVSTISSAAFGLFEFMFADSYLLVSGTVYGAVLETDITPSTDNTKQVFVGMDASSPTYTGGMEYRWTGSAWNSVASQDACFYVYLRSLQSYSESTIKTQGSYSLKGVAAITDSLNKTLTRTIT